MKLFIQTRKKLLFFFSLSLVFLFTLLLKSHPAYAQLQRNTISLTISPPSFELNANPGDRIDESIKLTNTSDNTITYETIVEDFRVEGTEGVVSIQEDANPKAFSKWFTITPSTIDLAPRQTRNVRFTINVPMDGEPGGHFASVLFQPKIIENNNSSTGAQVQQRIGSLILLRVSGDVKEQGSISKFSPKSFTGSWEEVTGSDGNKYIIAKDEKLDTESPKSYFSTGPVAFDLLLENQGNVHYKPLGTVVITNIFGQKVDEIKIDPRNVFPGGERRITVIWPKKNLWGIYYRAHLTALYGDSNQTLTAQTAFFAFPMEVAVAILVVIIVVVLLRKRLWRAIKILMKG